LDDLSRLTDERRTVFPLQYNLQNVTVSGPNSLWVEVSGNTQRSFANTYDTTFMSHSLSANKGYKLTSDGRIQFVIPPRSGAPVLVRVVTGSANTTARVYPFKPTDILMGY